MHSNITVADKKKQLIHYTHIFFEDLYLVGIYSDYLTGCNKQVRCEKQLMVNWQFVFHWRVISAVSLRYFTLQQQNYEKADVGGKKSEVVFNCIVLNRALRVYKNERKRPMNYIVSFLAVLRICMKRIKI